MMQERQTAADDVLERARRILDGTITSETPVAPAACCGPVTQSSCCTPAEKPGCCGTEATAGGGCGCQ